MADTGKRLVGPLVLTTTATTYYTVPAATTTILRNIHASVGNSQNCQLNLSIGVLAAGTYLFNGVYVPANSVLDWAGFIVMTAGEVLQASYTGATPVLVISGIEVA